MDRRRQGQPDPLARRSAAQPRGRKKKEAALLSEELDGLLAVTADAAANRNCARRLRAHLQAVLLKPERSTLTNLICMGGTQHQDWTADYRLYSRDRVKEDVLFQAARDELLSVLPESSPLVVAVDDTLARKRGTHIHGVAWRRDPLGPPFQTNLVLGQRFVQLSAAWPTAEGGARMVPIAFRHAPTAPKPPKEADENQLVEQRKQARQMRLNAYARALLKELRESVPLSRKLVVCGDGSYTNKEMIKGLPAGCTYIGRIRKDAHLHYVPAPPPGSRNGRPPVYGPPAPTPEALRTDETVPWRPVRAFAAGKTHEFRVKMLEPVLWEKAGPGRPVRVMVIAPLGYKLRNTGKLLYRRPAFLVCTDPELTVDQILQYYLWRWGIEVNFREEKTLVGMGQAQVRTAAANRHLPATVVAAYALLWVAALRLLRRDALPPALHPPKWRAATEPGRSLPSTGDLVRTLRYEIWGRAIRPGAFHRFASGHPPSAKCPKPEPSLPGAILNVA